MLHVKSNAYANERDKMAAKAGRQGVIASEPSAMTFTPLGEHQRDTVVVLHAPTNDAADLGFRVRGGAEHGLPIAVSHVEKGGVAELAGIKVGCEILAVNQTPLHNATHKAAVQALNQQQAALVELRVRYNPLLARVFLGYTPPGNTSPLGAQATQDSADSVSHNESTFGESGRSSKDGTRPEFANESEPKVVSQHTQPQTHTQSRALKAKAGLEEEGMQPSVEFPPAQATAEGSATPMNTIRKSKHRHHKEQSPKMRRLPVIPSSSSTSTTSSSPVAKHATAPKSRTDNLKAPTTMQDPTRALHQQYSQSIANEVSSTLGQLSVRELSHREPSPPMILHTTSHKPIQARASRKQPRIPSAVKYELTQEASEAEGRESWVHTTAKPDAIRQFVHRIPSPVSISIQDTAQSAAPKSLIAPVVRHQNSAMMSAPYSQPHSPSAIDVCTAAPNMQPIPIQLADLSQEDIEDLSQRVGHGTKMPENWTACVEPQTGKTFYANKITKKTSWVLPQQETASEPVPKALHKVNWEELPFGWERAHNERGEPYYINHINQTNSWDSPRLCRQKQQMSTFKSYLRAAELHLRENEGQMAMLQQDIEEGMRRMERLRCKKRVLSEALAAAAAPAVLARIEGQIELLQEELVEAVQEVEQHTDAQGRLSLAIDLSKDSIRVGLRIVETIKRKETCTASSSKPLARECNALMCYWRRTVAAQIELLELVEDLRLQLGSVANVSSGHSKAISAVTPEILSMKSMEVYPHIDLEGRLKTDLEMMVDCVILEHILIPKVKRIEQALKQQWQVMHSLHLCKVDGDSSAGAATACPEQAPTSAHEIAHMLASCNCPSTFKSKVQLLFRLTLLRDEKKPEAASSRELGSATSVQEEEL
eukprot:m.104635 g.104635  ORF g.104635 m.104635 type:complete len:880 (+) comp13261_c0_seq8:183-2822(+)